MTLNIVKKFPWQTQTELLLQKGMGILAYFSAILTKGNNICDFLFASLENTARSKWSLLLKEEFALKGVYCFSFKK